MAKEKLRIPAKVERLVRQIAYDHGRPPPRIEYVVGSGGGWARGSSVVHFAVARRDGKRIRHPDWKEMKSLLVHEMAHILSPNHHHSATMWATYWRLVKQYRVDRRTALERTASYKVEGIRQAALADIPGAQALLDQHQRALNEGRAGSLGQHRCRYGEVVEVKPPTYERDGVIISWDLQGRKARRFRPSDYKPTRRCSGERTDGKPCGGLLFQHFKTEGQVRVAALTPIREDQW